MEDRLLTCQLKYEKECTFEGSTVSKRRDLVIQRRHFLDTTSGSVAADVPVWQPNSIAIDVTIMKMLLSFRWTSQFSEHSNKLYQVKEKSGYECLTTICTITVSTDMKRSNVSRWNAVLRHSDTWTRALSQSVLRSWPTQSADSRVLFLTPTAADVGWHRRRDA